MTNHASGETTHAVPLVFLSPIARLEHRLAEARGFGCDLSLFGMCKQSVPEGTGLPADTEVWALAEHTDDVEHWDVLLARRNEDTGEITPLIEVDGLTQDQADTLFRALEDLFPQAELTVLPS